MICSQARFKFTTSKEGDDNAQSKILIALNFTMCV